jgi:hypothetical protein
MVYYVKFEEWSLNDLPCTVEHYLEWAGQHYYHVEVTPSHLTCYNRFTNEQDANRYALTHDALVITDTKLDAWGE